MHLDEKLHGSIAVLSLRGEFIDDDDDFLLQDKIRSLKLDGIRNVVVDLGKVYHINSRGLGALISAVKFMRAAGGDIRFGRIDEQIKEIFVRTRLVKVFSTYETVDRALASYRTMPSPVLSSDAA